MVAGSLSSTNIAAVEHPANIDAMAQIAEKDAMNRASSKRKFVAASDSGPLGAIDRLKRAAAAPGRRSNPDEIDIGEEEEEDEEEEEEADKSFGIKQRTIPSAVFGSAISTSEAEDS